MDCYLEIQMVGWLIDGRGEVRTFSDPSLRISWGSSHTADEFARYAVRNMGFASATIGANGIRITWRPTFTTEETLAGLIIWLREQSDSRVVVSSLVSEWVLRVCGSTALAADFILSEFQRAESDRQGVFHARRRSPSDLARDSGLGNLYAALSVKRLACDAIELWTMLNRFAEGRYILTEVEGDRGPLRVLAWGGGYRRFSTTLTDRIRGKNFEDQPDKTYARWASEAYRKVHHVNDMVVENVEASTWCPGQGRRRISYTRLLAPVHIEGRGACILSTAETDSSGA